MAAQVKLETEDEEEVGTADENSSQEDGDCELDRMLSSHDSNGSTSERHMSLGMDAAGLTESSQYALPQSMMFTDEEQAMVDMDISNETGILKFNMDIREPLSRLRTTLENRLEIDLSDYEFYLQDVTRLDDDKNMVEQCMQGEGVVQINVQLKVDNNGIQKINIVDVLKPSEEFVEIGAFDESNEGIDGGESDAEPYSGNPPKPGLVRWMIDVQFKKEMEQLHIPQDPAAWNKDHVRHWLKWAVRTFNLSGVKLADWNLTGEELCNLSLEDYHSRVPSDPGDTFWLHLQLMRKCKFVAVMHQVEEDVSGTDMNGQIRERKGVMNPRIRPHQSKLIRMGRPRVEIIEPLPSLGCGNRTGNNGQIQLWQFLLELLTDKEFIHAIQWLGAQGEFKLSNPELVAQLWGARKNKPLMNYEKLSRALRYYYDGEMIAKVPGKRFVYKFVCDLKELIGYSAAELNQRVLECEAAYQEQLDAQQNMLSSGEFCLVETADGDAKMEAK